MTLQVTFASGLIKEYKAESKHEAITFSVTPSGALIVFRENMHGAYQIATFAAGTWAIAERA